MHIPTFVAPNQILGHGKDKTSDPSRNEGTATCHHHKTNQGKSIFSAHFLERPDKNVSRPPAPQEGEPPITAERRVRAPLGARR